MGEELTQVREGLVAIALGGSEQGRRQVIKLTMLYEVPDSNEVLFFLIFNCVLAFLFFLCKLLASGLLVLDLTSTVIESPYSDGPLLFKNVYDVISVIGNALFGKVELPNKQLALQGILIRVFV